MRRSNLYFLVGVWTLLLGSLGAWNRFGPKEFLADGSAEASHRTGEEIAYILVWSLGLAGILVADRRITHRERERARLAEALRTSEERFRSALEAVGDGVWDWNAETNRVYFSPSWKAMLGFADAEIGDGLDEWESRVHPEDHAATMAAVQRHLAGETERYENEHRVRCKDGSYKWILDRGRVISRRPDGRPLRMIGTHHDLTLQKQTEAALRQSEEQFRAAVDGTDMAALMTADSQFTYANAAALRLFAARSADEIVGHPVLSRVHPDFHDNVTARARRVREGASGAAPSEEKIFVRIDGTPLAVEVSSSPIVYRGQRGAIVFLRDIAERRRAQLALEAGEARFRSLFDHSPAGIFEEDFSAVKSRVDELRAAGAGDLRAHLEQNPGLVAELAALVKVLLVNNRGVEILGARSPDELLAGLSRFFSARSLAFFREEILALADGRTHWRSEIPVVNAAGEERQLDLTLSVQPGCEVSWARVVVSVVDITERIRAEAGLRQLSRAVEQSPVTIVITDPTGAIEYANPQFTKSTGYTLEEVKGRNPRVLKSGLQAEAVYRELWHTIQSGREWRGEFCNRRKDGSLYWEEVSISPVFDESRRITHYLAVKEDITQQRQTLTALRQSEQRFRSLVESLPNIAVQGYDRERRVVLWNPASTALYGYSREEALGRRLEDLIIPPAMREAVITAVSRWIEHGEAIPAGELTLQRKNGSPVRVFSSHVMLQQSSGELEMHCIDIDLTEQKLAEAQVREQAALLEVTQDAILVLDLDRTITFWNQGAEKLYGVSRTEALGRRYETIAYPEVPPDFEAGWEHFLASGTWAVERRQVARTRGEIIVQKRGTLVRDELGRAKSALVVVTDVTEAKRLESQFLRAQRIETLGSLAGGVAHDLNNVLTPILMAAGMLSESGRTARERDLLQLLSDSARRGADIVQQLLIYGRGSDSPRTPMNVAKVTKDLLQIMRETFPKGIAVSVQAPADLWMIDGDRTQIHQVLLNLCVNARDAMPIRGSLAVTVENVHVDAAFAGQNPGAKPGAHVLLRVKDSGGGIAPAHIEKIFDPFFTTKPPGQGTGLGLATVLGIVRSHGGFITVETQLGLGSEFTVYLPARASAVEEVELEEIRPSLRGQGELVLIIEDEVTIRTALRSVLLHSGYRVVAAADGAEGIAVFVGQAAEIRLVITDMMMPVMDGTQAIRALRRLNPRLPVIAVSGVPGQRADLTASFGPHIRFLPKPFLVEKALTLVRDLLEEPAGPRAAAPTPAPA